jgi:hypothetical protein
VTALRDTARLCVTLGIAGPTSRRDIPAFASLIRLLATAGTLAPLMRMSQASSNDAEVKRIKQPVARMERGDIRVLSPARSDKSPVLGDCARPRRRLPDVRHDRPRILTSRISLRSIRATCYPPRESPCARRSSKRNAPSALCRAAAIAPGFSATRRRRPKGVDL